MNNQLMILTIEEILKTCRSLNDTFLKLEDTKVRNISESARPKFQKLQPKLLSISPMPWEATPVRKKASKIKKSECKKTSNTKKKPNKKESFKEFGRTLAKLSLNPQKVKEITINLDKGSSSIKVILQSATSEEVLFDAYDKQLDTALIKQSMLAAQVCYSLTFRTREASVKVLYIPLT